VQSQARLFTQSSARDHFATSPPMSQPASHRHQSPPERLPDTVKCTLDKRCTMGPWTWGGGGGERGSDASWSEQEMPRVREQRSWRMCAPSVPTPPALPEHAIAIQLWCHVTLSQWRGGAVVLWGGTSQAQHRAATTGVRLAMGCKGLHQLAESTPKGFN
jgi:hypothetical protein